MPTYTDIDLTLSKQRDGDIQKLTNIDAIDASLKNILGIRQGEYRMQPEYFINLWNKLFEPMDEITAYDIGEEILNTLEKYETRINIQNIHVAPKYEKNRYDVIGKYILKNSNRVYQFETFLQRE